MEFDGEVIKFNMFDAMRFPHNVIYLCALDVNNELSQKVYELSYKDELLIVLTPGLNQFVFQSVPCHVDSDVVDSQSLCYNWA